MKHPAVEPRGGNADFPVGQRGGPWVRRLENRRYAVREVLWQFWEGILAWLAPGPTWRRYRVAPRANPAAFRHSLLRGIQLELHRAGLAGSRKIVGRTTL